MRINTNVASLVAQENAANTSFKTGSSLEKLSSGLRINKAADDASGLAIADKLRTQGTSIDQGISNGNSAITLLQIADKSMSEQSNILDTIKSKLIQANTDTTSDDGREAIRKDISKLLEQLDNIAEQTNYNGNVLLQSGAGDSDTDKTGSTTLSFQIGESKNDIISNDAVQSNTVGLGSKETYESNMAVTVNGTQEVGSEGIITIKGADSTKNAAAEEVELSGDVDSLKLTVGMTLSNVDADTQAILDSTTGITESAGTYTVGTASTIDLTSVSNVQATVTTKNEGSDHAIATGTVISGVTALDDSALEAALNSSDFTKAGTGAAATYTSVGSISLTIESGETITATPPATGGSASGSTVTTGIAEDSIVSAVTATSGSALATALADASKFIDNGNGTYRAIATGISLDLGVGETLSKSTFNILATGTSGGTFDKGDIITATNVASGSLLHNELNNSAKFTQGTGAKANEFTVKENYTVGDLRIGAGESISIQQGVPLTTGLAGAISSGLTLDTIRIGTTTGYIVSGNKISDSSAGSQLNVAGSQTLTFNVGNNTTGATTATGSNETFDVKKDDIITAFSDKGTTSGRSDQLSLDIYNSAKFDDLGNGTYQARADFTLNLDKDDTISVSREVGSNAAATLVTGTTGAAVAGAAAAVSGSAGTPQTFAGQSESVIEVTTDTTLSIKNVNSAGGDTLNISAEDGNTLNNGKLQLSAIADLDVGELTKELADSFQAVVDDAITELNGYRGDIGSTQNQVESAVRNLMTQSTNVKAAESIIRDVDYAKESANFNKQNIIAQAGTYAMSQANSAAQNVLRLLQ